MMRADSHVELSQKSLFNSFDVTKDSLAAVRVDSLQL